MKKINYLLIAAIASLTVASCQKEQAEQFTPAGQGAGQEFTVSLPEVTKTALVEGKTVWAKNDSLWISNGTLTEKIGVPEESWGQKSFTFKTKGTMITPETPNMYVVYPYEAASGVKEGKLSVKIPGIQKGEFNEANIVAAQTTTYSVSLKNVTAILKVTVPPQAETKNTPIYSLAIGATNGNALSGTCTVDFSGSDPVLTPTAKSTSISAQIDGLDDKDFYFAVIPGTYDAGFTLTAATTSFEYASETKTTKSAKTVKVNELVNLGSIGTDLKPLQGTGEETDPWQIESLGHMIALASAVNDGNTFEGKFFKVMNDISGVTNQIGYLVGDFDKEAEREFKPFQGTFDGNNKAITLDLNGLTCPDIQRIGLFGELTDGATIKDLTLNGTVETTGGAVAALAGRIDISATCTKPVTISHVTNNASVKGSSWLGGIVGYAYTRMKDMIVIDNCTNTGIIEGTGYNNGGIVGQFAAKANTMTSSVTNCTNTGNISGTYCIGGICGYSYVVNFSKCNNSGNVTASAAATGTTGATSKGAIGTQSNYNRGTGGISGWSQNCTLDNCTNSGDIKGSTKVGGISGADYWSTPKDCTNNGKVEATSSITSYFPKVSAVGGIVGWHYVAYRIQNCTNNGQVKAAGGAAGGIVGEVDATTWIHFTVENCVNTGSISANGQAVGGIAGRAMGSNHNSTSKSISFTGCKNTGTISNASSLIGGIVGHFLGFQDGVTSSLVENCVNEGSLNAMYWIGGMVGYATSRVNGHNTLVTIRNCENKGVITANRSDADNGEQSGGILGAASISTSTGFATGKVNIFNCLNNGNVEYKQTAHKGVYMGGIVGRGGSTTSLENVVNNAYVGPVGQVSPAEGANARLGALFGSVDAETVSIKYSYYKTGVCANAVGTDSKVGPDAATVTTYNADGELSMPIKIGESNYSLVDEALNAWVTLNKTTELPYFSWTWSTGPAFVKE